MEKKNPSHQAVIQEIPKPQPGGGWEEIWGGNGAVLWKLLLQTSAPLRGTAGLGRHPVTITTAALFPLYQIQTMLIHNTECFPPHLALLFHWPSLFPLVTLT